MRHETQFIKSTIVACTNIWDAWSSLCCFEIFSDVYLIRDHCLHIIILTWYAKWNAKYKKRYRCVNKYLGCVIIVCTFNTRSLLVHVFVMRDHYQNACIAMFSEFWYSNIEATRSHSTCQLRIDWKGRADFMYMDTEFRRPNLSNLREILSESGV